MLTSARLPGSDLLLQAGAEIRRRSPTTITAADFPGQFELQAIGDIQIKRACSPRPLMQARSQQGSIIGSDGAPGDRPYKRLGRLRYSCRLSALASTRQGLLSPICRKLLKSHFTGELSG
jgi:hypothetical protein